MAAPTITALRQSGLFDDCTAGRQEEVEAAFATGNISALFEEDLNRAFHADAEDLAEGGIGAFLRETAPLLEKYGVTFHIIQDHADFEESTYTVEVNGEFFPVYDAEHYWQSENVPEMEALLWGKGWETAFRILNLRLEHANSPLRAYGYLGGHDGYCIFLTPAQWELIMQFPHAALRPDEMPYTVIDRYPDYGHPPRPQPAPKKTAKKVNRLRLWIILTVIAIAGKIYLFSHREPSTPLTAQHISGTTTSYENTYHIAIAADGTLTRSQGPASLTPIWVVLCDQTVVLKRGAHNETSYRYFAFRPGHHYSMYLEAWVGNGYKAVSNRVEYQP